MSQSNRQPISPGGNTKCPDIELEIATIEMLSHHKLADDALGHTEHRQKSSKFQNICDISVKTEHEFNACNSIDGEKNCEKISDTSNDQTAETKVAPSMGSRSKLIYSCHRCKLIFNSRISFELHYK